LALRITTGEENGVTVLWLDGRIVLGAETEMLRETVKSLLAQGKKKLVLNMNNVTLVDSSGLGALVAAYSSARSAGASPRRPMAGGARDLDPGPGSGPPLGPQ